MKKKVIIAFITVFIILAVTALIVAGIMYYNNRDTVLHRFEKEYGLNVPKNKERVFELNSPAIDGSLTVYAYKIKGEWSPKYHAQALKEYNEKADGRHEIEFHINEVLPDELKIPDTHRYTEIGLYERYGRRFRDYIVIYDYTTSTLYTVRDVHQW